MRYELTDYEWAAIKSFLPNKPRGGRGGVAAVSRLIEAGNFHDRPHYWSINRRPASVRRTLCPSRTKIQPFSTA
jgi:hypothetical protein